MTNAEKIRSMSDKELAEIIMCPYVSVTDYPYFRCIKAGKVTCIDCCLEWLGKEKEK